ncbi:uncharacterized protein [Neodiprion pinetum]|uniref:uncharacterized protein n=1 Tax=Neodiprion pinetum TaxID=441929 RepID=UPI0037147B2C
MIIVPSRQQVNNTLVIVASQARVRRPVSAKLSNPKQRLSNVIIAESPGINGMSVERAPDQGVHAFSKLGRRSDEIIITKNKVFSCSLDTGGDCSLISDQTVTRWNLTRTPRKLELSGLGGCTITSTEIVETLVSLKAVDFICTLHIVNDGDMPTDVLIGRDVMDHGLAFTYDAEGLKVDIQTGLTGADRSRLLDLLDKFERNITTGIQLTTINNADLTIKLKRDATFFYRPYRMFLAERKKVREIIEGLLKHQIIQPSNSQYASPTLLVRKNENEDRMCHDFRRLNELTVKDRYPIPRIDDQLDRLGNGIFFTSLDMASGFYQVPIAKESRDKTSFVTPDGQYEYLRMLFGLANAPATFQRAINNALGNLRYTITLVYLDDVLIPSKTIDEGLRNLQVVLQALTSAGFSLNYKKCRFFETKIEYLGREISASGIRPTDKKIEALTQCPVPNCIKQVRQFVGLANYFRRCILAFSIQMSPITALMKKDAAWNWTSECELARVKIITILTSKPILKIFDHEKPTELHTDASSIGVAAILMQWDGENRVVVAYFSKKNSVQESKRHSYEFETLAVVTAVKHFRCYLLGIKFKVVTDCDAVKSTMVKRHINGRVARWWTYLQDFEFEIEYRAGKKLAHVDYLSRNLVMIMRRNCIPWLVAEQAKEDEVQKMIKEIRENQNAEMRKLYTVKDDGQRYVLSLVDEFTKFCILKSAPAANAVNIIAMLELQTSLFCAAKLVHVDRGKAFDSNIVSGYCTLTGTRIHYTTTGNHRGIASATGFTPLELLTGRTDVPRTDAVAEAVSITSDESIDEKRQLAIKRSQLYAEKYTEKWNEEHRPMIEFDVSDLVCIKSNNTQGKLRKAYDGPFKVIGTPDNHRYELHNLQTGRKVIRSSDQMRRWPTQSEQTAHVVKLRILLAVYSATKSCNGICFFCWVCIQQQSPAMESAFSVGCVFSNKVL